MTELREGVPEEVGMDPKRVRRARDMLHAHVDAGQTPTLVAVVARRGVIVLAEALGSRGPGLEPVALDSVFPIASVTKSMTATLVMILVEDGEIGLNRHAYRYLPELTSADNRDVLVHHLLTHTSGLDEMAVAEHINKRLLDVELTSPPDGVHPCVNAQLAASWDAARATPAGRAWSYTDHGYVLLGEIVRRVSGDSIDTFARRRLFEPLGMRDTGYVLREDLNERLVHRAPDIPFGEVNPDSVWPQFEDPRFATYDAGDGSVKATAPDLAAFAQMFLNRGEYAGSRLLSRAGVAAMTRNQTPGLRVGSDAGAPEARYGYGWFVDGTDRWEYFHGSLQPVGTLSHPGAGGTCVFVDPQNELLGVVLEVVTTRTATQSQPSGIYERFQNVVYSSLED